jgi:long-chain acyl-CoA synthetase
LNQQLDPHERLACLVLDATPWTVASGFVTPTLKVKRNQIEAVYGALFEAWTAHGSDIVWINETNASVEVIG